MTQGTIFITKSAPSTSSLTPLLDRAGLGQLIADTPSILIKPNLVEALKPPITTPATLIEQLILYLRTRTDAEIIIGEGSGAFTYNTHHAYEVLGYSELATALDVKLIDLNQEPWVRLKQEGYSRWPEMYLPQIAMESFLLSVPVLKAHSLAQVTLTMKNMMGLPPPEHYQEGSSWKKSSFHHNIQAAIADLNRYRCADFTLLDATVGMAEAHLWGPTCNPPIGLLAASTDPVAIDAYGAGLLNIDWQTIDHIRSVHNELGQAEPLNVIHI